MNNVILIERYSQTRRFWPNLERGKKVSELSVEQILNKYQGFEGEVLSLFPIPKNTNDLNYVEILDIYKNTENNYLILYVISDFEESYSYLNKEAFKVGYDVGACEENVNYSVIINEILFGNVEKLIVYKDFLNDHFLFPDRTLAEQYVRLHNELAAQGECVEDYMEMVIYEIWKQK